MCSCGGKRPQKPKSTTTTTCPTGNPCSNIGLSSEANAQEFVTDFKKLQKDWPALKPDEREQRIEEITNKQLKKSGVPPVDVVHEKLPKGNGGHLDFTQWQLALNEDMLKSNTLSDADAKVLANAAYHESRHAEQWYLMAQKRAADGEKATDIRDNMKIPGKVADEAKKNPLPKGTSQEKCAQVLHDSVYGKNAAARNQTLKDLMKKLDTLNKANENNSRIASDPKATKEQKEEALKQAQEAKKDFDKTYADYRNLPEEADAFDTGAKVDKNW